MNITTRRKLKQLREMADGYRHYAQHDTDPDDPDVMSPTRQAAVTDWAIRRIENQDQLIGLLRDELNKLKNKKETP